MSQYEYGNTRLRARLSELMTYETVSSFTDLTSVDSFISTLTKTPYRASIEYALTFAHGYGCIIQALQREAAQIYSDLKRFFTGQEAQKIELIFLREDLKNIKAILRGLSHDDPFDVIIASFTPLGSLPRSTLTQIAKSASVDEALNKMVLYDLPVAEPLMALKAQHEHLAAAEMEMCIEMWYFHHIDDLISGNDEDARLLREYHAIEADIVNLNTVLRFINTPQAEEELHGSLEDYLVPYGAISTQRWQALAESGSIEELISRISPSRYDRDLKIGLQCFKNTGNLSEFEANMRTYRLRRLARLPRLYPLGIGVALGYAVRKLSEIRNLNWIAKGISAAFEPAYIRENLEHVA